MMPYEHTYNYDYTVLQAHLKHYKYVNNAL